jgi:hypothetical protein
MQSLRDDIAYMKTLAQAGRQGQILGGSILLMCGLIFSTTSFISWAIGAHYLPALPYGFGLEWALAIVLQLIGLAILIPATHRRARSGGGSANSRLFGAVWSTIGMAIFVAILSCVVVANRVNDIKAMLGFVPVIMVLYGAGWSISATISGQKWMYLVAIGCALTAPLLGWVVAEPVMYLVFGAAIFLFMAVPGFKLVQPPRAI